MSGQIIGPIGVLPTAVATTAWDNVGAGHSANLTITNGGLTITKNSVGGFDSNRALASHSSGLYYYEVHVDVITSTWLIGIGNSSATLTNFIGADNNAVGWDITNGNVWINNVNPTGSPIQTAVSGNTLCCAVDMGNTKIWFRTNGGNWNNAAIGSQNPATNTGGINYGGAGMAAGPYFPMIDFATQNDAGTANFGATAYAQTPPFGFGNW